jgi:formate dehydrogenase iron-sulfur subunit
MARMKFLCDSERCIECNGCVTACKNEHEVPWGVNRRRVVTLDDGVPGEKSISVACMHCTDAPCAAVCPVDCFYTTEDGIVLHDKDLCIGCGYCFYACPFGAPQYPQKEAFGVRGKMDKCTFCAGGPGADNSEEERKKYGKNRLDQGAARRRRRPAGRHLPRARDEAQRAAADLGLGQGLPGRRLTRAGPGGLMP